MTTWKNLLVAFTIALLSVSFPMFLAAGYTALYWAWLRSNLMAALPYLPWARNFGMLAIVGAAVALVIVFSSGVFPIRAKTRLTLSILATATIGFFAEFRNEGKFCFKTLVHFFGPETWAHRELNQVVPTLGDSLYRIEYSQWNDFLMGPAIVSVLFSLVFVKIYGGFRDQGPISLRTAGTVASTDLEDALSFARTLMNVGLFWFFVQAWAEKAGYLKNPHSKDEIDLPIEFAGTMVGFWMARVLTRPFDRRSEKFRSTLFIDFVSSGVIGLLYTLIIGRLTEWVASIVAHALHPVVPVSLEFHEYTPLQQHMRPFELLLLAGAMWWGLNRSRKDAQMMRLSGAYDQPQPNFRWDVLITMSWALGMPAGYLLILATTLSIVDPQGLGWTLATAGAGMGVGTMALLLIKRTKQPGLTTVFGEYNKTSMG